MQSRHDKIPTKLCILSFTVLLAFVVSLMTSALPASAEKITLTTSPSVPAGGDTPTPGSTSTTTTTIDIGASVARAAKSVQATLKLTLPTAEQDATYGPYTLTLDSLASGTKATDDTTSKSIQKGSSDKQLSLYAYFDNVAPGLFKVCLQGYPTLCAGGEKIAGTAARVTITVPVSTTKDLTTTASTSTCNIGAIGWIVCPVINFLANIADSSFYVLSNNFLKTDTTIFSASNPTYKAWTIMRNIANVAFVIAFLIIIFSELSTGGFAGNP